MKRLICEMCGGTDLIKQDGVFVCQSCGCKYSVEEARKLMIEGPVDVSGSTVKIEGSVDVSGSAVKIDTQQKIKNLYEIARRARDDNNSIAAADYYDMVLQEDPFSWEASFYATYYMAMNTKVGQIAESAATVRNSYSSVLNLIKKHVSEEKQEDCVKEMIARVKIIADMFLYNVQQNKDNKNAIDWARYTFEMQYTLGDCIMKVWLDQEKIGNVAAIAWETAVENNMDYYKKNFDTAAMEEEEINGLYSVTDLYAKRISAIDHDYYQNYINRKKSEQLERQRKIIEDEIDWRTNEKCRLENELKNAGIFCNKALIKDRIAFLKAKIDALCKQVSELK